MKIKFIIANILAIPIIYLGYTFFNFFYSGHHSIRDFSRYIWLFKEASIGDIDTFVYNGNEREKDVFFHYLYKKEYGISIWEFKDLGNFELNDILINYRVDLSNIEFKSAEILNSNSLPTLTTKLDFTFDKLFNINLDVYSKVYKTIEGKNYKGFYGYINKMSLSDVNEVHKVIIDYPNDEGETVFLIYKTSQSIILLFSRT